MCRRGGEDGIKAGQYRQQCEPQSARQPLNKQHHATRNSQADQAGEDDFQEFWHQLVLRSCSLLQMKCDQWKPASLFSSGARYDRHGVIPSKALKQQTTQSDYCLRRVSEQRMISSLVFNSRQWRRSPPGKRFGLFLTTR